MWLENPKHPRDCDGPRGYVQLAIPNVDKSIEDDQDFYEAQRLEMSQKMSKKQLQSPEEIAKKAALVTHGFDDSPFDSTSVMQRAMGAIVDVSSAVTGDASHGIFGGMGLMGRSVEDLMSSEGGARLGQRRFIRRW